MASHLNRLRRRELLTGSAAFAAMTFAGGGTVAAQGPFSGIFGALLKGAAGSIGSIYGPKLIEWLKDWWTGQPPGLGQQPPPPSGWPSPRVLPPNYFLDQPVLISLWLSPRTTQIYEIRVVGPYFLISSLNPLIPPFHVGGGVIQLPILYVQAMGPPTGPFAVGQYQITGPPDAQRLLGLTHYFQPQATTGGWMAGWAMDSLRIR